MKSRLDLDQSLETPGAGAVSREERDSVATVSQVMGGILGELGWRLCPLLCCTGHLVYGVLAGSVGLDVPGGAGLGWAGHGGGVHGGVHVGGDCLQQGHGAGAGGLSCPGLGVGGGEGQRCDYLSGGGGLVALCVPRMSSQDLSSARPNGYLV